MSKITVMYQGRQTQASEVLKNEALILEGYAAMPLDDLSATVHNMGRAAEAMRLVAEAIK